MSDTTEGYRLAHTMIRVSDLERSLHFYCDILGMRVLRRTDYPDGRFTNTFIGYGAEDEFPTLELTHNWERTEPYDKGNSWGHICIETPNVYQACENLAAQGVKIIKPASPMKHGTRILAFVEDPDGYKVELNEKITATDANKTTKDKKPKLYQFADIEHRLRTLEPGKSYIKPFVTSTVSDTMCGGLNFLNRVSVPWRLTCDEIIYCMQGVFRLTCDGETYVCRPGDVLYIPRDNDIAYECDEVCVIFYAAYPHDWKQRAGITFVPGIDPEDMPKTE